MTMIYNGGHEPLVPNGRWGEGVITPGEGFETDNPESYGSPWTTDSELAGAAAAAYAAVPHDEPSLTDALHAPDDGVSGAEDASQGPSEEVRVVPITHPLAGAAFTDTSGRVIGHYTTLPKTPPTAPVEQAAAPPTPNQGG